MKTAPNTETSIPERTPSPPSYPTEITVLVFILILAAALRFYGLGYQGLWNDELASWAMSNKDSLGEVLRSAYEDNHPPGYHFFLYFVIRLFGDSEISLRFPSAICGVISVFLLFILGRRLYSPKEGLLASALLAVLWCPIFYSQMARVYSLLVLLGLMTVYFGVRLLEPTSTDRLGGSSCNALLYVSSAIACSYLHYYGAYFVGLQGIAMLIITSTNIRRLALTILIYACIFVAYVPWLPEMFNDLGRTYPWSGSATTMYPIYYLRFFCNKSELLLLLSIAICVLAVFFSARRFYKNQEHLETLRHYLVVDGGVLAWLIVPFALVFIASFFSKPLVRFYSFVYCLPALCLLLSRAVLSLPVGRKAQIAISSGLVGLFLYHLVVPMQFYNGPHIENYWNHPRWAQFREVVDFVAGSYKDYQPSILIVCPNAEFFDYYFRRQAISTQTAVRACEGAEISKIQETLREHRAKYVWYLYADSQPDERLNRYLQDEFALVKGEQFECAGANLYVPRN
jgi:mannosyltransferase